MDRVTGILGVCFALFFMVLTIPTSHIQATQRVVNPAHVPLVIIRFNQRNVYFERQLYQAVERAVKAKPTVQFNVVSYVPLRADHQRNQRALQTANTNRNRVLKQMRDIGVPRGRIGVHVQSDTQLKFDEVHIFVQ